MNLEEAKSLVSRYDPEPKNICNQSEFSKAEGFLEGYEAGKKERLSLLEELKRHHARVIHTKEFPSKCGTCKIIAEAEKGA